MKRLGLFLATALLQAPVSARADCTNLRPVDCYTAGLEQVQETLGRVQMLEDAVSDLKREDDLLKEGLSRTDGLVSSINNRPANEASKLNDDSLESFAIYLKDISSYVQFARIFCDVDGILFSPFCTNHNWAQAAIGPRFF